MRRFFMISLGMLIGFSTVAPYVYAQNDPDLIFGTLDEPRSFKKCLVADTQEAILDCLAPPPKVDLRIKKPALMFLYPRFLREVKNKETNIEES